MLIHENVHDDDIFMSPIVLQASLCQLPKILMYHTDGRIVYVDKFMREHDCA